MLPEPLHPAVVHFPLVLAMLLPISAAVALWTIHRGARPLHTWSIPLAIAVAAVGSGWLAMETGEAEEETVEAVVAEGPLHEHEEAAERFLVLGGIVTLVMAGGLAGGTVGAAARLVGVAGTLVVVWAGVQVGELGGRLVYTHGAASAYVDTATAPSGAAAPAGYQEEDDEH